MNIKLLLNIIYGKYGLSKRPYNKNDIESLRVDVIHEIDRLTRQYNKDLNILKDFESLLGEIKTNLK